MEKGNLIALYRRSEKKYIEALYRDGEIYINHIRTIRYYDDNKERSDPWDGISSRIYQKSAKIELTPEGENPEKSLTFDAVDVVLSEDHAEHGNIYCMSLIKPEHFTGSAVSHKFDTSSFGQCIILIKDPSEFIRRFESGLKENGFENVFYKPVSYFRHDYSGHVGFFRKHERFKSQNEFRFFVPNTTEDVIKFNIGSLENIAVISDNGLVIKGVHSNKCVEYIYI